MDIGCYCISLARFIFGSEPQKVFGKLEYDPGLIEVVLDEYNTDIGEGGTVLPLTRSLSNGVVELGAVLMEVW